jgi:hypothetical protein
LPAIARAASLAAAVTLVLVPLAASAQEGYTFTVAALGGVGGSVDAEPGDELGNTGLQLNFALVTDPKTHLGLRLGRLDLDSEEGFGRLAGAELDYATIAGEYRHTHSFYESGVYIGLGAYRLTGDLAGAPASEEEDTAVGGVLGLTGDFAVTQRLSVLVEISGHWADLDEAQVFGMGHIGLAVHF